MRARFAIDDAAATDAMVCSRFVVVMQRRELRVVVVITVVVVVVMALVLLLLVLLLFSLLSFLFHQLLLHELLLKVGATHCEHLVLRELLPLMLLLLMLVEEVWRKAPN